MAKESRGQRLCVGIIGLIVGIGIVYWSQNYEREVNATDRWRSTQGLITHMEIAAVRVIGRHADSTGHRYHANVTYTYRVLGKDYTSDRITYGGMSDKDRAALEKRLNALTDQKKRVTVYFQTEDPSKSYLIRPTRNVFIGYITYGGMAIAGICVIAILHSLFGMLFGGGGSRGRR